MKLFVNFLMKKIFNERLTSDFIRSVLLYSRKENSFKTIITPMITHPYKVFNIAQVIP